MLLRAGEPGVRIFRQGVVGPEAILFFVGRVDHTGNVAGTGQDKADIAAVSVCPVVSGFPLGDVVLSRRQEERWHPDFRQVDGFAVHGQGIRLHQPVMQVHFPQIVTVHSVRQVGAVGVPVQQVKGGGFQAFEVVVGPVRPEQVVLAQQVKREGHGPAVQVALALHGPLDATDGVIVDEYADAAGIREVQQGGQIGGADDRVTVLLLQPGHGRAQ